MSDELEPDISVGDVVALASGGPGMVVVEVSLDGDLYCQWFGDCDILQEAKFPRDCVRISDGILRQEDDE